MTTNLRIARKFIRIFCISIFSLSFTAFSGAASAQDSLRNSVYGDEKQKSQTTVKSKSTTKKGNQSKKTNGQSNGSGKTYRPKTNVNRNLLTVVFTTRDAQSEIWLNDKSIGLTDDKSQLSKKLAAGDYRIMVKRNNRVVFPMQKISVNAERTNFNLYTEPVIKPVVETKPPPPQETKKSEMEIALEASAKVREILENHANSSRTDTVTLADWEMVFQAAQLGQLQGYTAVQIEAQRWYASGQIELAKNNYPNAFTAFNKAIEFMPNSALPFYALGTTYLANKQLPDALKSLTRALQIDPKMGMAYKKLGDVQRMQDKEKEAIASYKYAIQFGYNTPETRRLLGEMLIQTKKIEEGLKELEEVAKEQPSPEAYIAIGDGYELMKRDVSAIEFYRKAIELAPNSGVAYFKLANVLYGQREFVKAKEAFEKALELDPDGKTFSRSEAQKKLREAEERIKSN